MVAPPSVYGNQVIIHVYGTDGKVKSCRYAYALPISHLGECTQRDPQRSLVGCAVYRVNKTEKLDKNFDKSTRKE
jgi:hypothetical protein